MLYRKSLSAGRRFYVLLSIFTLFYCSCQGISLCFYTQTRILLVFKKQDSKLCSHNICSLLGNSTVKMLFGMHYENSGQDPSMQCSYCSSRSHFNTWLFNILWRFCVKLSKIAKFQKKHQKKNLHTTGIKIWCVGNTSLVTKLDNYLLK